MNSKERHELRYQRRKQNRLDKKMKLESQCNYENAFTFEHLYASYIKCCKGVGWKSSTQKYKANALLNINSTYKSLIAGKFKGSISYEFDIIERGKKRHIQSIPFNERIVQRCLSDYCLVPILKRSFVYDNGACIKHRGVDFTMNRLNRHLEKYYRRHGSNGYALVFDFSKYFDNINHEQLLKLLSGKITDNKILNFLKPLIESFGDKGLGLGSQISQICALAFPNNLDHYIKERLGIKYYCRYMDDGCLIHNDKEYLKYCLEKIKSICDSLGIKLNEKKTQIVKLSRGIPFLKTNFILSSSGRVIRKPNKKNITLMRRKLKTFRKWVDEGKMTYDDVLTSLNSWLGNQLKFDSYWARKNMHDLFVELFHRSKN